MGSFLVNSNSSGLKWIFTLWYSACRNIRNHFLWTHLFPFLGHHWGTMRSGLLRCVDSPESDITSSLSLIPLSFAQLQRLALYYLQQSFALPLDGTPFLKLNKLFASWPGQTLYLLVNRCLPRPVHLGTRSDILSWLQEAKFTFKDRIRLWWVDGALKVWPALNK